MPSSQAANASNKAIALTEELGGLAYGCVCVNELAPLLVYATQYLCELRSSLCDGMEPLLSEPRNAVQEVRKTWRAYAR